MANVMSTDRERIEPLLQGPGIEVFAWKNVLILIWNGDATAEVLRLLVPTIEAKVREVGRVSMVNIVASIPSLPDEERRQAYNSAATAHGEKIAHVAIVLEGEGFLFSAVRGLITGILLASPHRYSTVVMTRIEEVISWLPAKHAASTGVTLDPTELRETLVAARRQALGP